MQNQKNQIKEAKSEKNQVIIDRFLRVLWRREVDCKLNVK